LTHYEADEKEFTVILKDNSTKETYHIKLKIKVELAKDACELKIS